MPLIFQLKFHNKEPRFDYSAVEYFSCRLCRHVNQYYILRLSWVTVWISSVTPDMLLI